MMNAMVIKCLLAVILHVLFTTSLAFAVPAAKVTVKVVDEQGFGVEGAEVIVGFVKAKPSGWGTKPNPVNGVTDPSGMFSASGETGPSFQVNALKDGWYRSKMNLRFNEVFEGKRQPWNPEVKLVMRKIEDPVPMYARNAQIEIPAIGE
ncbi:MAG: hypothetical protein C0609_03310 [Deltaproteobacteria bacterium]|nr:MAG: hypothetical protein C0609_03310 [Deltaproteobacteria bacterium]